MLSLNLQPKPVTDPEDVWTARMKVFDRGRSALSRASNTTPFSVRGFGPAPGERPAKLMVVLVGGGSAGRWRKPMRVCTRRTGSACGKTTSRKR